MHDKAAAPQGAPPRRRSGAHMTYNEASGWLVAECLVIKVMRNCGPDEPITLYFLFGPRHAKNFGFENNKAPFD